MAPAISFSENIEIDVDINNVVSKVNPLIFGANIEGFHPSTIVNEEWAKGYRGFSNYGGGIWNPTIAKPVTQVINIMKKAGITILRFPGGTASAFHNWKETIGAVYGRSDFLFGLDEFLKTCEDAGATAVFTLPYFTGTPQDAADLVKYLNDLYDGSNTGGGKDWEGIRADNGHPEPYSIKFFELGNEVNHGIKRKDVPPVDASDYAKAYLKYREKMRSVDSTIQLGAVTVNSHSVKGISSWNNRLFQIAGHDIDFLIEHTYRPGEYSLNDDKVNANMIFSGALKSLDNVEAYYSKLRRQFEKVTGRKNIPIAVTEYNARFIQERPIPFRHSLGTALINAGLIQIYLKPENNILFANIHQLINGYWGMIKNDQFMKTKGVYVKRPNYYIFEMFNGHFGKQLLKVKDNTSKKISAGNAGIDLLSNLKWKTRLFAGADIKLNKMYIEINFMGKDNNFSHLRKTASVKADTVYLLSGYLKAVNLDDQEGVGLEIQDGRGWDKTRSAATTGRVWGSTDWTYVETEYKTLRDTSDVRVIIRRRSGHGPVKGRVLVKDVQLIEIDNIYNTGSELSVSASKSNDNKTIYIMVLNKNVFKDKSAYIHISGAGEYRLENSWTLNSSNVWDTNEKQRYNVTIKKDSGNTEVGHIINYTFPAHSLTSLEVDCIQC